MVGILDSSSVVINNSNFSGNHDDPNESSYDAAVSISSSKVSISNTIFADNVVSFRGHTLSGF
jgi:hypothetical protein